MYYYSLYALLIFELFLRELNRTPIFEMYMQSLTNCLNEIDGRMLNYTSSAIPTSDLEYH